MLALPFIGNEMQLALAAEEKCVSNPEFEKSVQDFLAPILSYLSDGNPSCQVYWVHPREPQENHDFSMPPQEVEHYTRSFMFEGFCVGIRSTANGEEKQLQIVFWEDGDGNFKQVDWPSFNGVGMKQWVWRGFSTAPE